ncbi:MAG: MBL fold metallo-hydrolase [Gemmatimonadota bacterium]
MSRGGAPDGARALLLALALSAPAAAQEPADVFDFTELAEGVFAATVRPGPPMYVFANSLVVVGEAGVLVVDAHASPSASRAFLRELGRLTDLPVTHLVNTHWHTDHTMGNAAFVEANPDVAIIATRATAEAMATLGRAAYQADVDTLPVSADRRRTWASERLGPQGQELSEATAARLLRSADLRDAQARELAQTDYLEPTLTFQDRLRIDLGDRVVEVRSLGPAHTVGDAVVWLSNERILAAGDLLEDAFPWIDANSDVAGWAQALGFLRALDAAVVLPAHGRVRRAPEYVESAAGLLGEVVRAALLGEETPADPAALRRFYARFGLSREAFDRAFAAAVASAGLRIEDR